jgi:hypothetical protein
VVTEATGESKVDDPARLKAITAISVDKHTWERGNGQVSCRVRHRDRRPHPRSPAAAAGPGPQPLSALCCPAGWCVARAGRPGSLPATLDPFRGYLDRAGQPVGTELTGLLGSECWPRRADRE